MVDEKERARFRDAFGAALDKQLKQRGLSQAALARRVGTSRSYLNQTMQGHKTPSPEWADKIADATNMTEEERETLHKAAARAAGYRIK